MRRCTSICWRTVCWILWRSVRHRLALGDAQEGYRLATDERAMARRELITSLILNVRSISSAFNAAEKLTDLADQDAQAVSALRR